MEKPTVVVLFGATGDLARRKLLPGLLHLFEADLLKDARIVGTSLEDLDSEQFVKLARQACEDFADEDLTDEVWAGFSAMLSYVPQSAGTEALAAEVYRVETLLPGDIHDKRRLHYLSVPPKAALSVLEQLQAGNLVERARIIMEKPFGTDLESAKRLNARVHEVFDESQVFRIDHFLGKEAVQNILALRFANGLFEPAWDARSVESVQIDVPEELGLEGRGSFYEATGALRDMISTHLTQILGFVALEDPGSFDADALRDAKAAVFEAMRPLDPERSVFGQFEGYREEDDVDPDSDVETFVALEAWVDNDRWRGVPFLLRTGKAMAATRRTVTIRFRTPQSGIFERSVACNELVLELTDSPVVTLHLQGKLPGPDMELTGATMCLDLGDVPDADPLEAYERLILDVLRGDRSLFTRADEVDRIWQVCQPLLDSPPAVQSYPRGSWGPDAALDLPPGGWRLCRE